MIRHAHTDRTDAVGFGAFDGFFGSDFRQHMADAVVAVDHRHRTAVNDELRLRHRIHHLVAQTVEIPAEAQHAVRLVPPQIGLHQRVGNQQRVGFGHALTGVNSGAEFDQFLRINRYRSHRQDFPDEINWSG